MPPIRVENPFLCVCKMVAGLVASSSEWIHHILLPVILHEVFEILTISRSGIWNIVVREPSLKLRFMPLVVS